MFMQRAIDLSVENVKNGGGPFGAVTIILSVPRNFDFFLLFHHGTFPVNRIDME